MRVASLGTQKPLGYSWEFQSVPHLILGHVDFLLDRNVTYVDGTKVDPLAPSPSGNCASRDCVPSKLVIAKKKEKKNNLLMKFSVDVFEHFAMCQMLHYQKCCQIYIRMYLKLPMFFI